MVGQRASGRTKPEKVRDGAPGKLSIFITLGRSGELDQGDVLLPDCHIRQQSLARGFDVMAGQVTALVLGGREAEGATLEHSLYCH